MCIPLIIKLGVIEGLLCRRTSLTPLNYLYIIQKADVTDELIDSFKLSGHILLALLTLSNRIISPRLSSVTKKEKTCPWRPGKAKMKKIILLM